MQSKKWITDSSIHRQWQNHHSVFTLIYHQLKV